MGGVLGDNEHHPETRTESDVDAVTGALMDGDRLRKEPMEIDDIDRLKRTVAWGEYRKYIRVYTHSYTLIRTNLDKWYGESKNSSLDPKTGRPLFTYETRDALKNAKGSAIYVTDVLEKHELYEPIAPLSTSLGNLCPLA